MTKRKRNKPLLDKKNQKTFTCGSLEWNGYAPLFQQFQNFYSYSYFDPYSRQGQKHFSSISTLRPPAFSTSVARKVPTQPKARWNNLQPGFTLLYVLSDDSDMLVPVRPCVLMPETHHMTQLMSHNTKLVTVLSNGYSLRAPSSATHVGATPGKENPQTHAAHQWLEELQNTGTEHGIWQSSGQASSCIHYIYSHVSTKQT